MSLASSVSDLATRIASYLKTSVLPRLIPAGGAAGQVLAKSAATDYSVSWVQGWTSANFDPSTKANVSGQVFSGSISISKANDAVLTLEDTAAPTTTFRRKQIFSSGNVGGGDDWLFRQIRPSDGAVNEFYLKSGQGGTIWTSGNFNPANYANINVTSTFTAQQRIPLMGMPVDNISTAIAGGMFYTTAGTKAKGWPEDSNSYQHLLSCNYPGGSDYYALQLAGGLFDNDNFYIRKTATVGLQPWRKLIHDGNLTESFTGNAEGYVIKFPNGSMLQGGTTVLQLDANGRYTMPLISAGVTACVPVAINGDLNVNNGHVVVNTASTSSFGVWYPNSANAVVRLNWYAFSRWK